MTARSMFRSTDYLTSSTAFRVLLSVPCVAIVGRTNYWYGLGLSLGIIKGIYWYNITVTLEFKVYSCVQLLNLSIYKL